MLPLDSRSVFTAVLDALVEPVIVTDADGILTFANPTAVLRFGADRDVGHPVRGHLDRLQALTPGGHPLPTTLHPIARALAQRQAIIGAELTIDAGAGAATYVVNTVPLWANESMVGTVSVFHDVTTAVRLERELADHAARLDTARAAAEEANRLKDQFIAALSHELRTPLQPILGWTEVLRRHGNLDDVTVRAIEAIHRNIRQQVRLVDDLLDLSRIVHGKFALRFETFDLREHVRAAADAFEEAATLKRVRLSTALAAEPLLMWGDGARLQQITSNLIGNAIKFTPPGGQVQVRVRRADSQAVLEIEDTGEGITPEDLPIIFEAFRQGTQARRRGGLGIGLDLVRRLTELHGGRVEAFSDGVGRGARFRVEVPLVVATVGPIRRDSGAGGRLGQCSVLIVEDNADTRDVLKVMLEAEGAQVETAATGDDGVRAAETMHPAVVLCDIGLPDFDGLEVARRIRARENLRSTRLIALTGYGQAEDVRQAVEAGFEAHLTKPVNIDQLMALLAGADGGVVPQK